MEKEAKWYKNSHELRVFIGKVPADQVSETHVKVFGYRLEVGDTIQPDDVYDSTSGKWERAPCPGLKLGEGALAVWVRPTKE